MVNTEESFKTEVEVKRIDLGWILSHDYDFEDLAIIIQNHDVGAEIAELESYQVLFEASWLKIKSKILKTCFASWMIYMFLGINFFLYHLYENASIEAVGFMLVYK